MANHIKTEYSRIRTAAGVAWANGNVVKAQALEEKALKRLMVEIKRVPGMVSMVQPPKRRLRYEQQGVANRISLYVRAGGVHH